MSSFIRRKSAPVGLAMKSQLRLRPALSFLFVAWFGMKTGPLAPGLCSPSELPEPAVVGVANAPVASANGWTAKVTSPDWSAPVTYVPSDKSAAGAMAKSQAACVDVAPVFGKDKAEEMGGCW